MSDAKLRLYELVLGNPDGAGPRRSRKYASEGADNYRPAARASRLPG